MGEENKRKFGSGGIMDREIIVGVCAMSKKVQGKEMREIMGRLSMFPEFKLVVFPEDMILHAPIEEWPLCDTLISFFSTGFPLEKAEAYASLRKPFMVNDLSMQRILTDRRKTYAMLQRINVPVPRYACMSRDQELAPTFAVEEDSITVNGARFEKPFVEKPVSGEDHNIIIYYPRAAGGGSQRLFRKVGDRSSEFCPDESLVRLEGSYIYEEFLPTQGTDVKVYTVGPSYFHAEARKAPAVDGRVTRNEDGKEVRYPIMLTAEEKAIALKITLAFKQTVCGFDLLRANGKSYVCDVNGWSFVKNSLKYYDDSAQILREIMLRMVAPRRLPKKIMYFGPMGNDSIDDEDDEDEKARRASTEELRSVIAIFRHGDRTPKQKLKMRTTNERFLAFFSGPGVSTRKEVKLKSAAQLQRLLDITRSLLQSTQPEDSDSEENLDKLKQMRAVLEKGGKFHGINRKVQIKPQRWETIEDGKGGQVEVVREGLLILKWGGELTEAGRAQAERLGHDFRGNMYPGRHDGLLRLHSTYRHDLKIYASDEGRVQMTAAAFAKGLLDLEGELTPILVSLVIKDKQSYDLLDDSSPADHTMHAVKQRLHSLLTTDVELDDTLIRETYAQTGIGPQADALRQLGNPRAALKKMYSLVVAVTEELRAMLQLGNAEAAAAVAEEPLYQAEPLGLVLRRWRKLERDFFNAKKDRFDPSKIPDIYDCARYDALHNQSRLQLRNLPALYEVAKALADYMVPQEYGMTASERRLIGHRICSNLVCKLLLDLETASGKAGDDFAENCYRLDPRYAAAMNIKSPGRQVRTRLYFTSESHIQTFLNMLRYGASDKHPLFGPEAQDKLSRIVELDYFTSIVFRLYEDTSRGNDPARFRVSIAFSSGADGNPFHATDHHVPVRELEELEAALPLEVVEDWFRGCVERPDSPVLDDSMVVDDTHSGSATPAALVSPRGPVPLGMARADASAL